MRKIALFTVLLGVTAVGCGGDDATLPISINNTDVRSNNGVNNVNNVNKQNNANNQNNLNNGNNSNTNAATNGMPGNNAAPIAPRRWAMEQRYTHDADRMLGRVLERDNLEGACDRWVAGARDDVTKYQCGKWMFFYETFGTVGIPKGILEFNQKWYQDYFGPGFNKFGFVPDPNNDKGMPIGLAPTTGTLGDNIETVAFTCASCHFGQMPDGRYAVGYGNLQLDYGKFIATLGSPLSLSMNANDQNVHPDVRAELGPLVETAKQDQSYMIELGILGLSLLSASQENLPDAEGQAQFLALKPGTMDFLTPPLVDDGVWTVSRILSLWNIPSEAQRAELGMEHEMLSWTGGAKSLDQFISGFVAIGVSDPGEWGPERIEPLKAYVASLQVPELETSLSQPMVEQGAEIFVREDCVGCHNGPSGESTQAYSFDEIGTDGAMEFIFNPDENDVLCCGFDDGDDPDESYQVTRGVKAPRMVGVENQTSFLHNGSVDSLQQLFCMQTRPVDNNFAQGSQGHEYGCDLSQADKTALIMYLNSL